MAGCPLGMDASCPAKSEGESTLNYTSYLQLDKILDGQVMQSELNGAGVHDEHLFIITHQAYELWFKQVIYEIDSVRKMFMGSMVDESKTLIILNRLQRIVLILKLMVDQIHILETMTPLDFLEFRLQLSTSSGFQSLQFRLLENKLGVLESSRVKYNQEHYAKVFDRDDQQKVLKDSVEEESLFALVERWLERTPGLAVKSFNFWQLYKRSVERWLQDIMLIPAENAEDPAVKKQLMDEYKKTKDSYDSVLNADLYNASVARGDRRLSHQAFKGAILISLYTEQPRFNQPSKLLSVLMDIDSLLTKWRYNHVIMVQRMIGSKVGTGGSSGYQYLRSTVSDRYKVFLDLFNVSTYLIPRAYIPPLSRTLKRQLSVLCAEHPMRELSPDEEKNGVIHDEGDDDDVDEMSDGLKEKVVFEV